MPARAMPVITALWWGPTQAWAGSAYEIPGQWLHWLSSGTPAWTIVRRSGRKTSSTVQSKLPVARSPDTSQLPSTVCASERWKTPRQ